MKRAKVKAIVIQKIHDIASTCKTIEDNFDQDTIHDFRIKVRSLRSFLRLQRIHSDEAGTKISKKFMQLYHIAGRIRDTQLEIDHLAANNLEIGLYPDQLHHTLELQKEEWRQLYSKKTIRKLSRKLSGLKYKALPPYVLRKFFNDRMGTLDMITGTMPLTDTEIHDVRKKIKDILYTSKIAKKKWKAAVKLVDDIPVKQLEHLADLIGDRNDDRIMLEHLTAFSLKNTGKPGINTIKLLMDKERDTLLQKKKDIVAYAGELTLHEKDNTRDQTQ